jgi:hypothetical protein
MHTNCLDSCPLHEIRVGGCFVDSLRSFVNSMGGAL